MPSPALPYPVFDADHHFYEPEEALLKYLPKQYKGAIEYVQVRGRTKIAIRGQISEYIPNPTFDVVAKPGAMQDYFKNGNPEGKSAREILGEPMKSPAAFREPTSRIQLMDEQGVDRVLMFPTLASLLEERMRDDVELIHAVVHSLNQWIDEVWSFNYKDRIFTTPVITLPIVDKAIDELNWAVERGARAVLIRPAPVPGLDGTTRSFALPEFDPFWKRVVELDVLVALHSSDNGYARYVNDWEGHKGEFLPFVPSTFKMLQEWRGIADTVGSLICHGALSRFPDLKIATIENGTSWLAPLIDQLNLAYKKMPQGFTEHPVDVLKRNIHINPFGEDDMYEIAGIMGVDRVLFGSDSPHPEGIGDPLSYVEEISDFSQEDQAKIMGGNLARLVGVSGAPRAV